MRAVLLKLCSGSPKVQAELHMGDGQKGLLGLRLPSARFASLFLLHFIVGRVQLWWKKQESLAPWSCPTCTSDSSMSLFQSLFPPLPVVAGERVCFLPLRKYDRGVRTFTSILIQNGKGVGWGTSHLEEGLSPFITI